MSTFHRDLTGNDLHEPKGIETALSNQVYVSDGVGSGGWSKLRLYGFENNADSGNNQVLVANTPKVLSNDTNGIYDKDYLLPGRPLRSWDAVNNEFNFSNGGLQVDELVEFTLDIKITPSAANSSFKLVLSFANNTVDEFNIEVVNKVYKDAVAYEENHTVNLFIPAQTFIDNPCKVIATTDTNGSIVVNRFYLKVTPTHPVVE